MLGPEKLIWFRYSQDIDDVDKCLQEKYCLDKRPSSVSKSLSVNISKFLSIQVSKFLSF